MFPSRSVRAGSRGRRAASLCLEVLEDRLTPSFAVLDTPTALTFTGDNAGNALALTSSGNRLLYSVNGGATVLLVNARTDSLTQLTITCGSGNDTVDVSALDTQMTALLAVG